MAQRTIRSATERDVDAVLELWRAVGGTPTVTDTPAGLRRLLATDPDALIVVDADGTIVGSLIVAWDGWRGSFYRLAISAERRRLGLASALLREGERRLRARGAVGLTAVVDDSDSVAMAFWRAAGYERQGHRARFILHARD
jgi:ribosomal protein S18 acetylase RimI-like enzyme